MKNQLKILGTLNRGHVRKDLIKFAKFWNSKPTINEFNKFTSGIAVMPQHIYWMTKYPDHDIPVGKIVDEKRNKSKKP